MLKKFLMATAITTFGIAPAFAQQSTEPAAEGTAPPPPAAEQPLESQPAPGTLPAAPEAAPEATVEAPAVEPPPSDAIITAESTTDLRADKLIGMTVYNSAGEEVGKVDDILLDKEGKVSGVVLDVGGFLGLGGKSVGIAWKEVSVAPEQDAMQIAYSKEQLQVAPEFRTLELTPADLPAATSSTLPPPE
ncbi:MAG: PRC-barrel domain-containing protein [Dongiaceae bacterium]